MKVESVKLLNRPDGWGDRLGDSEVEVDGKLCGKVESKTAQGKWYTVTCTKPVIGKNVKVISKESTPLHFAEVRVMGKANRQCIVDACTGSQFLLKTGKCAACPTGYIQDPLDKTNCIFSDYIKEIKCKRGHRVDQISIEKFSGAKNLSHNGRAGGSWRNKDQIVKLNADEWVKRVDGHHITKGNVRG